MRSRRKNRSGYAFCACFLPFLGAGASVAGPPEELNFQGILRDASGLPLDSGPGGVPMRFRYFDAATGGNEVLVEEQLAPGVVVAGGLFNAVLGAGTLSDGSGPGTFISLGQVFRRLETVFLEVEIQGEILSPRIQIRSSAWSLGDRRRDPPCHGLQGETDRFLDCGNGTVTDTATGLVWLRDANCFGVLNWWEANAAAAGLGDGACGLTDGSSPGDWRLPTRQEWKEVLDQAVQNGCTAPVFPDALGLGCCGVFGCPFSGVQSVAYWASQTFPSFPVNAHNANMEIGTVEQALKDFQFSVWPVRDGP